MNFCPYCCVIALIFLFGKIYFMWKTKNSLILDNYKQSLRSDQRDIYEKIIEERASISNQGYILGVIASLVFLFFIGLNKNYKTNRFTNGCFILVIMFIVNYFYYVLSPKKYWMLNYIGNDQKQVNEWLIVYRNMQYNYHFSFIVGILAVSFIGFSIKC
jgi:hypothetical protein